MASPSSVCHLVAGSLGELSANLFLGFAYRNSILLNGKGRLAGGFVLYPNAAAGGSQSPPQCFSSCGKGKLHGNRRKPCEGANRERWRQGSLRNACCRAGTNGCRRVLCVIFCLESIDHPTIDSYGGSCRGRRKRRRQIGHNIRDLFDTCRSLDDRSAAMLFDERRSQILNR